MKYEEIKDFNDDIVKENSLWQEIMELKPIYQIILIVLILILFIVIIYLIVKFKSKVSDENNSNVKPENETKKFEEDVINSNVKLENETKKFEEDVINLMIDDIKKGCFGNIKVSLLDENKWQELFNQCNLIIDNFKNIDSKKEEIIHIKNDLIALISFDISVNDNSFQKISYNKFTELIKQVHDKIEKKLMFIESSAHIKEINDSNNFIYFKNSEVATTKQTEESFQIHVDMKINNKNSIYIMFNPINGETKLIICVSGLNNEFSYYYDGVLKPII